MAKKSTAAKVASGAKKAASSDLIFTVAHEVENLTAPKAFGLIDTLAEDIEANGFKLGGALSLVAAKCEDEDESFLNGHASFKELVADRFNIRYRKAMYLISIYRNLVENKIPWSKVKGLGWPKLSRLAPILTQKNVEKWVEKASKLTFAQVEDLVQKQKAKGKDASEEIGDSTVSTMFFKLKKDQKKVVREALDKAKEETKTDFDSVALANMATGYLGGAVSITVEDEGKKGKPKTKKAMKEELAALCKALDNVEEVLEVVSKVFPKAEINLTVD